MTVIVWYQDFLFIEFHILSLIPDHSYLGAAATYLLSERFRKPWPNYCSNSL